MSEQHTLRPDVDAALDFLRRWREDGPWVLTAIRVDKKSIVTRTFSADQEPALRQFLEAHTDQWNTYFSMNPLRREVSKKATREDVLSVDWLHVDVDPRAGETWDEERDRILALMGENRPEGVPEPTCVIFSGGGYQAFWRLREPIPIDGNVALAEDAALYNIQLETLFGADHCHNIDRVMRLPGTVNVPDEKKRKRGRVPALAALHHWSDAEYDLSEFRKAPAVQVASEAGWDGGAPLPSPEQVERIQDHSELDQWGVPDRVKVIMAQGRHPDEQKEGDDSRSAWLFDFCCQMVRCGVPDEVTFAIITDPGWPISASVLDLRGSAQQRYALRQIARAREWAVDPELERFNSRFAVVRNFGGKCLVVEEVLDYALKRKRLTNMSLTEFAKGFEHQQVSVGEDGKGNPKFKPAGQWWRQHPKRRQYETIVFAPEQQVPPDVYNLWRGFGTTPQPGECSLFLAHVRDNICAGNQEHYEYLVRWMARAVQQPAQPGEVAVVMRGGRGVGKSLFARVFGSLFGHHYMQVSNSSHLVGNFNAHLRDLVVLFADEAFYAGDKKHESILKTLISEDTLVIEKKGVDVEISPNCIHLIIASNEAHVIPAGADERRFFVLEVSDQRKQDTAYFRAMMAEVEAGGREALLHELMTMDVSDFDVRRVPQTDALREQKALSLGPEEDWWFSKLEAGALLPEHDSWDGRVRKDLIVDDYVEYAKRFNVQRRKTETALGRYLSGVVPGLTTRQEMEDVEVFGPDGFNHTTRKRCRILYFPDLQKCRSAWEERHGSENWSPAL